VVYIRSYLHWKADEKKIPAKTINDLKRENEEFYATQTSFE
jgi:hypothetical protein